MKHCTSKKCKSKCVAPFALTFVVLIYISATLIQIINYKALQKGYLDAKAKKKKKSTNAMKDKST